MMSIVSTECHVPKTLSDWAKIAAWGRLGLDKRGAAFRSLGRGDGEHQGAAFKFDIAEHRGAVRHRHTPSHAPGAFRFSVRFIAQPVPKVRGFPLKRRDSIQPLADQRLGHATYEGNAPAVEQPLTSHNVVPRGGGGRP